MTVEVLHRKDLPKLTGLSLRSIDRAIASGKLRTKKYGARTLILREEVDRFNRSHQDKDAPKSHP